MWTVRYRGRYIHGYFDRDECRAECSAGWVTYKSLRAAQLGIARGLK